MNKVNKLKQGMVVECPDGRLGTLDRVRGRGKSRSLEVQPDKPTGAALVEIPERYVAGVANNKVQLNMSCEEVGRLGASSSKASPKMGDIEAGETLKLPVIQETLVPVKSWKEAGAVEIRKVVSTVTQEIDVPVAYEEAVVERVPINRVIAEGEHLAARQDDETLIVPVVREEVVVTKQRVLVEELHVTKRTRTVTRHIAEPVQQEEVQITHQGLEENPTNTTQQ